MNKFTIRIFDELGLQMGVFSQRIGNRRDCLLVSCEPLYYTILVLSPFVCSAKLTVRAVAVNIRCDMFERMIKHFLGKNTLNNLNLTN